MNTIIEYVIIAVVLLIICLVIFKLNKKNFSIEANKLINYLGGKDNIINAECNMSRFKVIVNDVSKVDKEAIMKLGAKGVVEIDNQIKIIFGNHSKELKKYIEDML